MRRQTLTTLVAVALLAVAAGGAFAAVTWDTETTNTATTSNFTDADPTVNYTESGDIKMEFETQGTASGLYIWNNDSGETVLYRNVSKQSVSQTYSDTTTTPSTYYWVTNVSKSKLNSYEMDAGVNETFTVRIINDTRSPSTSTNHTTVLYYKSDKRTYRVLNDSEVGDNGVAELETEEVFGLSIPVIHSDAATLDDDVAINGAGTEATYAIDNSTVADRLGASADGAADGAWILSSIVTVDDDPVRMYADEAPDSVDNGTTYAVWDSSNEEVMVHFGDDYDGQDSANVMVDANRGFIDQLGVYDVTDVVSNSIPLV